MLKIKTKDSFIKNKEFQFRQLNIVLTCLSVNIEKGWETFQEILKFSQKDVDYWDREETQKALVKLSLFIDRGIANIQDENLKSKIREFLLTERNDGLEISWDSQYFYFWNILLKDQFLQGQRHLYPEDIFGMLVNLDRAFLFVKEEQRKVKYEVIQHRINLINEKTPLILFED